LFRVELYFIDQLKKAPGKRILGIFSLGHLNGFKDFWDKADTIKIEDLSTPTKGLREVALLLLEQQTEQENAEAKS